MSIYLDASVVVPLFLIDPFGQRASAFLSAQSARVYVSDFVSAEFASVVGIKLRNKALRLDEARAAFSNFDEWTRRYAQKAQTLAADIHVAETMLRRLDLTLRAPDAISLAIARRLRAELATFDVRMAESARALGISLAAV
ncbi:MAG: type II toxin-antitoxin system VapC family toxin [Rhizomicrobium sp.]